ncbi:hypothetical protein L6164_021020 [Bauhinia variegata]|uniref:Uncharacterized protein n=1 Tax=Bauhinia variegata TaxID=167791 RepID=A0ACB9N270_BAUVA|nr:hypothetical protein L6164_021020 [Bauhinia variegata]
MLHVKIVLECAYNKVKPWQSEVKDLVLQIASPTQQKLSKGKLAPKWEDPNLIAEKLGKGTYQLSTVQGQILLNNWHVTCLKLYYPSL